MPEAGRGAGTDTRAQLESLTSRYEDCDLCSHRCHVDRTAGEIGTCQVDDTVRLASYGPHFGEERPLSGSGGSGTIFLAYCNLACVFCQNYELSQEGRGAREVDVETIADVALSLQDRGCHNVNFVSPTHFAPTLARAVLRARDRGLDVPIVWNCGGYENAEIIGDLDGIVDVYMPDVKWADDGAARMYSKAPGYWKAATTAIEEMHRQVGDLRLDERGIAERGVLLRHLVMPGMVENSKRIVEFVAHSLSTDTYLNLMAQYRPSYTVGRHGRYTEIDRPVTEAEYASVVEHARSLGLQRLDVNDSYL
ncbi:MAG: radical SAM protein [Halodesulfurarchaeum sp.]